MKKISIVIPAYNEENTIAQILYKVQKVDLSPYEKEIIVVDNNSTDKTFQIAQSIEKVRVFIEKQKGKGSAVKKGLEVSTGDLIIIQDADLEYNPHDIPNLLGKASSAKIVVYGSRNMGIDRKGGLLARLGVWFLTKQFNMLFNSNLTDLWTCYKLFPKKAIPHFRGGGFDSELSFSAQLIKNGFEIVEVPISYNQPRTKAEGKKIRYRDGIFGIFLLIKERFKN
jgi:dolichol-phosphate mannosyltransferase